MLKLLYRKIKKIKTQIIWRRLNKHNHTTAKTNFDLSKVSVGIGTYGALCVKCFGAENEQLIIGNYISIAEDVLFLLGGNHEYKSISTYPFKNKFKNGIIEAKSNGPIIVEDDVWIGNGALIMSGVKIGQGAIIGARSVVTRDVPPYSIVVGIPGKVIKKRFSDAIINTLIDMEYNKLDKKVFLDNEEIFGKLIENNDINELKKLIKKIGMGA